MCSGTRDDDTAACIFQTDNTALGGGGSLGRTREVHGAIPFFRMAQGSIDGARSRCRHGGGRQRGAARNESERLSPSGVARGGWVVVAACVCVWMQRRLWMALI